jgi:hypothetical protein
VRQPPEVPPEVDHIRMMDFLSDLPESGSFTSAANDNNYILTRDRNSFLSHSLPSAMRSASNSNTFNPENRWPMRSKGNPDDRRERQNF